MMRSRCCVKRPPSDQRVAEDPRPPPVADDQLSRPRVENQVPRVGEPVAAPERLELVAVHPPGTHDRVAGVVGDHDPTLGVPPRRIGLGPVRMSADLDRARRIVVEPRPPEPQRARLDAAVEHRVIDPIAAIVHPEEVAVGDHRIPAVATLGRRPVAGAPPLFDDDPAGVAVEVKAKDDRSANRHHALTVA